MKKKKKILTIEDSAAAQKIVYDLLTLRGGFEVIVATDGEEGLKKIREEKPDLALVDVRLPLKDGLEVTKEVRSDPDPAINKIPIIIVTSYAMPSDEKKGFEAGCNAYLIKPINLKELLKTVNELVS